MSGARQSIGSFYSLDLECYSGVFPRTFMYKGIQSENFAETHP